MSNEILNNCLSYDPNTGIFLWKEHKYSKYVGKVAGGLDKYGYRCIKIKNKIYKAHRLAWLYVYGSFPVGLIDHINGVKDDNRICNLRDVDRSINMQNRREKSNSESGFLGVYKSRNKWRANIVINGMHLYLGVYETKHLAQEAYLRAKRKYHLGCTI